MTVGLVRGDDAKKERQSLQGTWELTEVVGGGKPVPPDKVKGVKVVFSGDRMSLVSPGDEQKREFTFRLEPTTRPKAIDMTALDGRFKGETNSGVYQLEGDTLKLCMPNEPTRKRPTELASPEGSDLTLMILKKTKQGVDAGRNKGAVADGRADQRTAAGRSARRAGCWTPPLGGIGRRGSPA